MWGATELHAHTSQVRNLRLREVSRLQTLEPDLRPADEPGPTLLTTAGVSKDHVQRNVSCIRNIPQHQADTFPQEVSF